MTKRKHLSDMAQAAGETQAFDVMRDIVVAGVSLVPVIGGPVGSAIQRFAPDQQATYLRDFLREVATRIKGLEDSRVDYEYLRTEGFAYDVVQAGQAMTQARNREKRAHYLAAIENSAAVDRPGDVERHRFLDLLDRSRLSHLRLLAAVIVAPAEEWDSGLDDWFRRVLPNQDLENIKLDWQDMQREGMLQQMPSGIATLAMSERLRHAVPAIGRRFAAFVEADPGTNAGGVGAPVSE